MRHNVKFINFKLNLRMKEKIAGMNVMGNRELVYGVDLRAFVALKRMVGKTLQMGVITPSAEKQGTNVLYSQVSRFFEVLTRSLTLNIAMK